MDKTLTIISIVASLICIAFSAAVVIVLRKVKNSVGISSQGGDANKDGSSVLNEIDNFNDNLNEVKNIVNEHTTKEKDSIMNAFNSSNSTMIQVLYENLKSFKDTLYENLNATKEQLAEIREEMRLAVLQMSASTNTALESQQNKLEKTLEKMNGDIKYILSNLKEDVEKSLDRMTDGVKSSLKEMREDNKVQLESVKQDNEKQLEKMRETVDEKLSSTLDKRIQSAFEMVNDRLDSVQKGFGEMQNLSTKVTNLNKMFANVKTRGGWGEVSLESLLDQILSPEQYEKQFRLNKNSQEAVDFVIVMPGQGANNEKKVYLPIDSKFPLDKYVRLVEASEEGDSEKIEVAKKALIDEVKREARSIKNKYIKEPKTTKFAVMYVPTEGLYAEIAKDVALTNQLQNEYGVTVCGPTTIAALLNSLQVGFTTLRIQKNSGMIVDAIKQFKKDFKTYTDLICKVKKNATTVVTTIEEVEKRNRLIDDRLSKVSGYLPDSQEEITYIASADATEDDRE
ncbi:MAG: DNA recombination protein RmuC [Clostridia bacterium]|nr:DNA recombination protein RmuC [Clostridia bacterium]MDE7329203.1 DNA recombination protein RmuC [Clostridia bacterium]